MEVGGQGDTEFHSPSTVPVPMGSGRGRLLVLVGGGVLVLCTKHRKGSWATSRLGGHTLVPPCLRAWSLRVISSVKTLIIALINTQPRDLETVGGTR